MKTTYPRQRIENLGRPVMVCFEYNAKHEIPGTIIRDDAVEPFETIILLNNHRVVRAKECIYRFLKTTETYRKPSVNRITIDFRKLKPDAPCEKYHLGANAIILLCVWDLIKSAGIDPNAWRVEIQRTSVAWYCDMLQKNFSLNFTVDDVWRQMRTNAIFEPIDNNGEETMRFKSETLIASNPLQLAASLAAYLYMDRPNDDILDALDLRDIFDSVM